jgi:hypothetical protein
MSQEPEQIGDLTFVPNPEYPYPFPVEKPPHFWMTEQSGKLAAAMETYFAGEKLSPDELTLIKLYLHQYIERAVMTGDAPRPKLLQRVAKLRTTSDIEQFGEEIAEFGVEPF